MSLKETMQELNGLLEKVLKDLSKVTRGNKAASQRVRTGTIKLEKVAKRFRKESISAEKSGKFKKKSVKSVKKAAKKKRR